MRLKPLSNLALALSFLGLILASLFVVTASAGFSEAVWRKPLVGGSFILICVLGIIAGLFPSKCSGMFHFRRSTQQLISEGTAKSGESSVFRGHHPSCMRFRAHVLQIDRTVLCAGCIGLILGAVLSIVLALAYFFLEQTLSLNPLLTFTGGFLGVSAGLLQYHIFSLNRSVIHLLVNVFFVFGVSLLLVAVDVIAQNINADLYVIGLSLLWLYTRIVLSQADHQKICFSCNVDDCALR